MYTLAATLGVVVLHTLLQATCAAAGPPPGDETTGLSLRHRLKPVGAFSWWLVYACAAAAGMYTLYYFAFLLIPLNAWASIALLPSPRARRLRSETTAPLSSPCRRRRHDGRKLHRGGAEDAEPGRTLSVRPLRALRLCGDPADAMLRAIRRDRLTAWLLANLLAVALYAPWIPVAFRQATNPPVPPWRVAPDIWLALRESWQALSLGQSAPGWLWPVLALTLALYAAGAVDAV